MSKQKIKAEIREAKRLKQRFAPKGGTLAGQFNKMKTDRHYLKKKTLNPDNLNKL